MLNKKENLFFSCVVFCHSFIVLSLIYRPYCHRYTHSSIPPLLSYLTVFHYDTPKIGSFHYICHSATVHQTIPLLLGYYWATIQLLLGYYNSATTIPLLLPGYYKSATIKIQIYTFIFNKKIELLFLSIID
jgi:hypothetical protein